MAHNKGEITLLLPEKKTQDALLKKLQWTRSSLKDVFSKYHLHLDLVQEGSIRFKLRLASCPETLDELAHDQRIIQITQDLFSHESFRELACGQNLPVQFTCSVKMENVSGKLRDHNYSNLRSYIVPRLKSVAKQIFKFPIYCSFLFISFSS